MRKKSLIQIENDKKTIKINIAVSILLIGILSFVSVGYALYSQSLGLSGSSSFGQQGIIAITDVTLVSSKNVAEGSIPAFTDDSIDFNLTFQKGEGSTETDYQAVYSVTIENDTFYDYDFNLATFTPTIRNSSNVEVDPSCLSHTLSGITLGESIPAGESVTFTLTLDFYPPDDDTYSVDGEMQTDLEEEPHGSVLGSITSGSEVDLKASLGHDLAPVTISVINSYQSPRQFSLDIVDTSHFELVDSNGNPLTSFTVQGSTTTNYTIYVKRVAQAHFLAAVINTNITLTYDQTVVIDCGSIAVTVDEEEVDDPTPPEVRSAVATINAATSETTTDNNVGAITLNWDVTEAESSVKKYYVIAYTVSGNNRTYYNSYESTNTVPQLQITGLQDNNYLFKIYAENTKNHKPTDEEIESCNSVYCTETSVVNGDWHFTVSLSNSTNVDSISPTAVNRGKTLTATISAALASSGGACGSDTYYSLSSNITVKMGGQTISTGSTDGHYTYSVSNNKRTGTLTVRGVTGDIVVTTSAS